MFDGAVLDAIAGLTGVQACAIVDISSGMVVTFRGQDGLDALFESAVDDWRIACRKEAAGELTGLRAHIAIYAQARITLTSVGRGYIAVTISAEPDHVPWTRWKACIGDLSRSAEAARA